MRLKARRLGGITTVSEYTKFSRQGLGEDLISSWLRR
jgi:hypothetical protein